MRIAVCDDEKLVCTTLENFFKHTVPSGERCVVERFYTGEQLVNAYQEKQKAYDLIITDIRMPTMDGLEAGRHIRKIDQDVKIVILTNYQEYSLQSYDIHPYHYLLKPLDTQKMLELYNHIREDKQKSWREYLNLNVPGNFHHIPYTDILFLESEKQRVHIHTKRRVITVYKKLSDIALLLDSRFAITHKSYIVNLDFYENVAPRYTSLTLAGHPAPIPISRNMRQGFVNHLKEYVNQYGLV